MDGGRRALTIPRCVAHAEEAIAVSRAPFTSRLGGSVSVAPGGKGTALFRINVTRYRCCRGRGGFGRSPPGTRGTYIGSCNSTFLVYEKMQKALLHP